MHYTEYDTRLSAYAWILDDEDRVLLAWWNGEGRFDPAWSLPGGGIEFDEALLDGLVREVHEETGFEVEVADFLTAFHFTRPAGEGHRPFKSQRMVFTARIVGGHLGTVEVGGSTDYAAWVPLADLPAQPSRAEVVDAAHDAWRAHTSLKR